MLLTVLILQAIFSAYSVEVPQPPEQVHVHNWLMTWAPSTDDAGITYSVQSSAHGGDWADVPTCLHMPATSCDVTEIAAQSSYSCVMLRVRAEKQGLTSTPVPACSMHGDSCSPKVSLSVRSDSLMVHLRRNHSLAVDEADQALHRVYYGEQGEALELYQDSASSPTLRKLREGRTYCIQVYYILYGLSVGPPSCPQCKLLPHTGGQVSPGVIVAVLLLLIVLFLLAAYVALYQRRRIKEWLKSPCEIPEDFLLQPHAPVAFCSPSEERYDVISCVERRDRAAEPH